MEALGVGEGGALPVAPPPPLPEALPLAQGDTACVRDDEAQGVAEGDPQCVRDGAAEALFAALRGAEAVDDGEPLGVSRPPAPPREGDAGAGVRLGASLAVAAEGEAEGDAAPVGEGGGDAEADAQALAVALGRGERESGRDA